MATFLYKTVDDTDPKDRPRVYFTCHPDDFEDCFTRITKAIFATHDCAIYYTPDMEEPITQEDLETDLGRMNLFAVPVTWNLLTESCRAMEVDIAYAKRERISILPFVMEPGLDEIYAEPENFGQRQYLDLFTEDATAIPYEEKLRKFLESVLISDELAMRIRVAFDAYIFLSYRKKDRRYANELMKLIHKNPECRDIAIWYDEFLTPGESFVDNIQKALKGSRLFTLLVTPNLLEEPEGKPNYVMAEEYPAARKTGKCILPVEMERTDRGALREKFREIPECVDPNNETVFRERLLSTIRKIAVSTHKNEPEHDFLIGLAYREGIDVEVDRRRGIELITLAAEAELPEAMDHLYRIYSNQIGYDDDEDEEERNEELALRWAKRRAACYAERDGEESETAVRAMVDRANACCTVTDWAGGSGSVSDEVLYFISDEFLQESVRDAKKAYELCRKVFGQEHDCTVDCMMALATLLEELDHFVGMTEAWKEANQLREQVYALCRKIYGSHWMTKLARDQLLQSCLQGGRAARRLELLEEELGGESLETIDEMQLCQLALAYGDAGHLQKEKELLEKLCAMESGLQSVFSGIHEHLWFAWGERRKALLETEYDLACRFRGEKDWDTLDILKSLAYAYDACGDVRKAIACFEKHFRCSRERGDVLFAMDMERIAELYCDMGDHEKALALSMQYFLQQCRRDADDDMDQQIVGRIQAMAYMGMGECGKALQLQKKAYEQSLNRHGEEHYATIEARIQMAQIYCQLGDYESAMQWHRSIYERVCEKEIPEGLDQIRAMYWMALIRRGLGEYREAIELLRRAYSLLRSAWGEKHRYTLRAAGELANTDTLVGEYEKATELEFYAWAGWREMLGSEHPKVRNAANHLAYLHFKMGDMEKALKAKGEVLVARCKARGIEDPVELMALRNLSYDYRASDDPAEELAFDEKVYAILRDTLGEDHPATVSAQSGLAYACFVCGQGQKAGALFREAHGRCRRIFGEHNFVTVHALGQFENLRGDKAGEKYAQILRWML